MSRTEDRRLARYILVTACCLAAALPAPAGADGGVTFQDVAAGGGAGIAFERVPSANNAKLDAIKNDPPYTFDQRIETPMKARGAPGVALFDYDGDGDLDVYVTNGPGAANALFSNQLAETGQTTFVDVAGAAGVAATDLDATGVCFGDVDNDGDPDLAVLSHDAPNRLFENLGDGTFADVSAASGIQAGGVRASTGCSFGDVDGDGLLDLAIGNSFDDWSTSRGIFVEPFAFNQHTELYLNLGGNRFVDWSGPSGVRELAGFPAEAAGAAGLTWAIALVDVDLDGDVDLVTADDQGGIPSADDGGVDRGFIHIFQNDGSGRFTDVSVEAGTAHWGSWMGLSFGDFDCNGALDLFASNFGDYTPVGTPQPGQQPSRWFLGRGDDTFADPGVGDMVSNPFGWGTSAADYDNDGDQDVIYHGGHDLGLGIETSNGGVILENPGCSAAFVPDFAALAGSTDHHRRTVHGMAVGDLDGNGFLDIVSVSNLNIPEALPLVPYPPLGSPFDPVASFILTFEPDAAGDPVWNGNVYANGDLAVELNQGENGNRSLEIVTRGTIGLARGGRANRDGIGAVVGFRPAGGEALLRPIVGGASYASQDALAAHFGLGEAERGTVEVLWPGGVKNRLYNVYAGERIVFPEIPCSYDGFDSQWQYLFCVTWALDDLQDAGMVSDLGRVRFLMSALRARQSTLAPVCAAEAEGVWAEEEGLFRALGAE